MLKLVPAELQLAAGDALSAYWQRQREVRQRLGAAGFQQPVSYTFRD